MICSSCLLLAHMLCMTSAFNMPSKRGISGQSVPSSSSSRSVRRHESLKMLPSLVVFDLDNTLWTPELYQLRTLERANQYPVAHKDVQLFPAALDIIQQIKKYRRTIQNDEDDRFALAKTKFAIASRTKSVDWAHHLLDQFELRDFFDYIEIFPGDKVQHFSKLQRNSGIAYSEMIFFDDARDGRFGNCVPVSQLGVLSVHCPNGLYDISIWSNALEQYKHWSIHKTPGTIIEWDSSVTTLQAKADPNQRLIGQVKFINREKRFGFIRHGDRKSKDVFFHFSALPQGVNDVDEGDELSFTISSDLRNGKDAATNIEFLNKDRVEEGNDSVELRVFSMNLPFAALLSNGYKTLETRNGTMFAPYPEGSIMLLHVGQRTYPDGDRHIDVMKSGGLDDDEIQALKSLPPGFTKGMVVAIVELGKTYETTLEERCDPVFQRAVAAFGEDSGMRATEIRRVGYLKEGVKVTGQGGVFKAKIKRDLVPDGWLGGDGVASRQADIKMKRVYYSESF